MKKMLHGVSLVLALVMALSVIGSAFADPAITVSTSANAGKAGLEAVAPAFESATGIEVATEFMDVGGSTATSMLLTQLEGGSAPDIFVPLPDYKTLARAGHIMDLSNTEFAKAIPGSPLEPLVTLDGKVYAFMIGIQPVGIIYNTELFAQYNLSVPTTWDEFVALVKTMKEVAPEKTPLAFGGGNAAIARINIHAVIANQAGYTGNEGFEGTFSESPAYISGLAAFQELIDIGAFSPSASTDGSNEVVASMVAGDAFMDFDCSSRYPAILRADPECPIAMFPFPSANEEDARLLLWPGTIETVNANSKNPEVAVQFIEYMATPEGNTLWAESAGGSELPASLLYDTENWFDYMKPMAPLSDRSVMIPSAMWANVNPDVTLGEGVAGMLAGVMTAEDVLLAVDEAWEEMISEQ